jgi:adenylate kinase
METLVVEGEQINLPKHIFRRLKGKQIELLETDDGILLRPVEDSIKKTRGILKGSRFNTQSYFKQKQKEKELEK